MVSQLGSLAPDLVTPTFLVLFTPSAATQVAPVVPASSGNVTATGVEWFPESGAVPSLSSILRVAVEPLFPCIGFCAVTPYGDEHQDSSGCVKLLSSSAAVALGTDLLAPAGVSVFFQAPDLAAMDASALSMLGGPSSSSFMVEEDSLCRFWWFLLIENTWPLSLLKLLLQDILQALCSIFLTLVQVRVDKREVLRSQSPLIALRTSILC